jgi:SAM-dependent methyltransferase
LPDAFRAEFTGERVIPGRVEDNLFNEHLARYRFTSHLVHELGLTGAFLDAGCGAGYGAAELAKSRAQVLGIDVSPDAIAHARDNYGADSNLRFEQASCTAIPAADSAFRLITAFEVIEHLPDWREFLAEARRVLEPSGLFLVSTPNRLYYAESRQKAGPNPFHVHEFTEEEFHSELAAVFPRVKILLQNHVEGIAFSGAGAEGAALDISGRTGEPSSAHFFLAVCGKEDLPRVARFVFVPETGNVLQTRERHIALLEGEVQQKNQWIASEKTAGERMRDKVRGLETELEEHNRWAQQANQEADRRAKLVAELQAELSRSNEWAHARDAEAVERGQVIVQLQEELRRSNEWAQARDAEAVERGHRVEQLQDEVAQATAWARQREEEAEERGRRVVQLQDELAQATEWARSLDAEAEERGERILQLQEEQQSTRAGYEAAIEHWRQEKAAADRWTLETERRLGSELAAAQEAFAERITELQAEVEKLNSRMSMVAQSRWVRLGRTFRVGPEIART